MVDQLVFDLSDDERQLAYQRATEQEIWVSNFNGQNAKQITSTSPERLETYGEGGRTNPLWSPDGSQIAFSSLRGEAWAMCRETK